MRIAITADPELPVPPVFYGGIERIIDMLIKELVKEGHEVHLFANPDSKVPCKLFGWKGRASQNRLDTIKNISTLWSAHRKNSYEVVHSFGRLAYLLPLLPTGVKKIMSYQREPSLTQVKRAHKLASPGSLIFTGCSNYIADQIRPFAHGETVYNCVDTSIYTHQSRVDNNAPLAFLGRIEPIKGTHLAIEVAQRTGRGLIIAGNIPKEGKEYFEKMIKPYLSSAVEYIGPVNDQEKNEFLGKAAAFLMPIEWNEPFGIVMAEAMACGTPVIGLNRGSVPEVVSDGISGFVCNNVNEMVQGVENIENLSRDAVRKYAEKNFSSEVISQNYLTLYKSKAKKYERA